MTAEEPINLLKELPPEIKIVVRGCEEEYNDISELKPVKLMYGVDSEWYYGEYSKSNSNDKIDAIELFGENKQEERK